MTKPIDDPRPLPEVLRDWRARHGLSVYAATTHGKHRGQISASQDTLARWEGGAVCPYERELRALLTLVDEGRA